MGATNAEKIYVNPEILMSQPLTDYTELGYDIANRLEAVAAANPAKTVAARSEIDEQVEQLPPMKNAVELIRALARVPLGDQETMNEVGRLLERVEEVNATAATTTTTHH